MPEGGQWPDLAALWTSLRRAGYARVTALLCSRDVVALGASHVHHGLARTREEATAAIIEADVRFHMCLPAGATAHPDDPPWFRWRPVSFEALIGHPSYASEALARWCGLRLARQIDVRQVTNRRRFAAAAMESTS